ncbi:hypothetical protein V8G54_023478 [Vigna mungo]|uniref:Uncharacterized protein n=1 Tax=Vigna mungo TaxID=3915 RepID=A0AAQ3RQC5_VIGMU
MDIISSQGLSLLSVDVSGSQVTDNGLVLLKDCSNLQAMTLNYCDQFSEYGLKHISGRVKPDGMRAFSNLFNLEKLDLERCSEIHGGFVYLKGLKKLEFLNIGCCKCVTNSDTKSISGLEKLTTLNGCNITGACLESIHGKNRQHRSPLFPMSMSDSTRLFKSVRPERTNN